MFGCFWPFFCASLVLVFWILALTFLGIGASCCSLVKGVLLSCSSSSESSYVTGKFVVFLKNYEFYITNLDLFWAVTMGTLYCYDVGRFWVEYGGELLLFGLLQEYGVTNLDGTFFCTVQFHDQFFSFVLVGSLSFGCRVICLGR